MNRKTTSLIIVLVLSAALVSSCTLFGVMATIMGSILKVDDSGHFKEDIIYQWGDGTDLNVYALYADGTVESYQERYEDAGEDHDGDGVTGEGWVKIGGGSYKGTYTWDTDTYMLTETVTQTVTQGEWANVTNQTTYETPQFFSEHQFGDIFVKSETTDNQWDYEMTTTIQNTGSSVLTQTLTVNSDLSTFVLNTVTTGFDATGTQTSGSETEISGTFTLLPEDAKWKKGSSVTVMVTIDLTKTKSWNNTIANDWDAAYTEDNDQMVNSYTYAHMGDYVVQTPSLMAGRALY